MTVPESHFVECPEGHRVDPRHLRAGMCPECDNETTRQHLNEMCGHFLDRESHGYAGNQLERAIAALEEVRDVHA